ncbi:hypothetical protein OAS19_01165 [Altererythrobacter sp.]|nr:hypothetical protein [Altererythrobacter sp.]
METELEGPIAPALNLALAYAPASSRGVMGDLFQLETRLSQAVQQASEPIVAQLKLAWWRDRFAEPCANWPAGEPMLARLAGWDADVSALGKSVDGWEALLGEGALSEPLVSEFLDARANAWVIAATAAGSSDHAQAAGLAARQWALADLGEHLASPEDIAAVKASAAELELQRPPLPRPLRPMAVLSALGCRSLSKVRPIMDGAGAMTVAIRVGIFGR